MNLRPLGNRVLVRRLPLPDASKGGILVLGREYPTVGEVVAVGNGKKCRKGWCLCGAWGERLERCGDGQHVPCAFTYRYPIYDISVGDQVQYDAGLAVELDTKLVGPDLLLLNYDDLNLVIKD